MTVVREAIPVRDAPAVPVELWFTRHGPVIRSAPESDAAFAVRAAWLEPGMAPYLGSIETMRAPDVERFTAALNRWGAPGENLVYADAGTIGWKAAGLTPVRPRLGRHAAGAWRRALRVGRLLRHGRAAGGGEPGPRLDRHGQ